MDKEIKEICTDWGIWKRKVPNGFNRRNALTRIGEGACITKDRDFIPIFDPPERVAHIELAWKQKMTRKEQVVFYLRFVAKGSPKMKAEVLQMSRATFYRVLDCAVAKVK